MLAVLYDTGLVLQFLGTECVLEKSLRKRPIGEATDLIVRGLQFLRNEIDANDTSNSVKHRIVSLQAETLQFESHLVEESAANPSRATKHVSVSTKLTFASSGHGSLQNCGVIINVPAWVCDRPAEDSISLVHGESTRPGMLEYTFFAHKAIPPASMSVTAAVKFSLADTRVRCVSVTFSLPMSLACRVQPNMCPRNAAFKLTLNTDIKAVPLCDLFGDMVDVIDNPPVTTSAISFEFWFADRDLLPSDRTPEGNVSISEQGSTGTVIVSKQTGRYRLQSNALPALWLLLRELCTRLRQRCHDSVSIRYNEPLPLSDYYAAIDDHHTTRVALRVAESALNNASHQFRIIQKRLLIRFKDSRPAKIQHLDLLMKNTHSTLLHLASIVQLAQTERARSSNVLACSTQLLIYLMRLRFALSPGQFGQVASHLNPDLIARSLIAREDALAGWEETTDVSLTFLLKCSLIAARPMRGKTRQSTGPHAMMFPESTGRLKRRIAMVCDRLEEQLSSRLD